MEKKYQVFISSTFEDLKKERQAVLRGILELGNIPAAMELFPACDDQAWKLIQKVIEASDYYVLVIGGRYGSLDERGIGYTEKEYDYAFELNKPILALLRANPDDIERGKTKTDANAWEKLKQFRKKVEKNHTVVLWNTADELKTQLVTSLALTMIQHPAQGWIRAQGLYSEESIFKTEELQRQLSNAINFISGLAHCPNFCAEREHGWNFGNEYTLIKSRTRILHKFESIIRSIENDSEVMFISPGSNLGPNAWNTLLKRIKNLNLRIIVSDDKITNDTENLVEMLSRYTTPIRANTHGIRLLVVKGREGYICNSKSTSDGGKEEDYWSIYTQSPVTLKMMEIVFEHLWDTNYCNAETQNGTAIQA
jgi:hypothetical protein